MGGWSDRKQRQVGRGTGGPAEAEPPVPNHPPRPQGVGVLPQGPAGACRPPSRSGSSGAVLRTPIGGASGQVVHVRSAAGPGAVGAGGFPSSTSTGSNPVAEV